MKRYRFHESLRTRILIAASKTANHFRRLTWTNLDLKLKNPDFPFAIVTFAPYLADSLVPLLIYSHSVYSSLVTCKAPFVASHMSGSCIHATTLPAPWQKARSLCVQFYKGDLLKIISSEMNTFVHSE